MYSRFSFICPIIYHILFRLTDRSFKLNSLSKFGTAQDSFQSNDSVFSDVTKDSVRSKGSSFDDSQDTTPAWLKQELDDGEVIH